MKVKPDIIFSDFDGTLSHGHDLCPVFFDILKLLKKNNIPLIIVTGRSLSWGHFFLTHFDSLEYVIAEGGGTLTRKCDSNRRLENKILIDPSDISHLEDFTDKLLLKFKNLKLSADSVGRISDRAIELQDLLENPILDREIREFMMEEKINFSTSNVHLNFWSGEISKYQSTFNFMQETYPDISSDQCLFFGDSLNDESMFLNFKHSVGVSNISSILGQLNHPPKTILKGSENVGPFGVLNYLINHLHL